MLVWTLGSKLSTANVSDILVENECYRPDSYVLCAWNIVIWNFVIFTHMKMSCDSTWAFVVCSIDCDSLAPPPLSPFRSLLYLSLPSFIFCVYFSTSCPSWILSTKTGIIRVMFLANWWIQFDQYHAFLWIMHFLHLVITRSQWIVPYLQFIYSSN